MNEFVMIVAAKDRDLLGPVRCLPGLQAAEDNSGIWLRGLPADNLPAGIEALPALQRFVVMEGNLLFPFGGSTPTGVLPTLSWQALSVFLPVTLPVSGLPGQKVRPYEPRLIASGQVKETGAILVNFTDWKAYVEHASSIRLKHLSFAASQEGLVLVIGNPLPPLRGDSFWILDNLLVPAGFDFDPPLVGMLASEILTKEKDKVLLFGKDGSRQSISSAYIIPATRASVRLIEKGGVHG